MTTSTPPLSNLSLNGLGPQANRCKFVSIIFMIFKSHEMFNLLVSQYYYILTIRIRTLRNVN